MAVDSWITRNWKFIAVGAIASTIVIGLVYSMNAVDKIPKPCKKKKSKKPQITRFADVAGVDTAKAELMEVSHIVGSHYILKVWSIKGHEKTLEEVQMDMG